MNTANKINGQGDQLTTWEDVYHVTLDLKKKKGHQKEGHSIKKICVDNHERKFNKIITVLLFWE